MKKIDVNKSTVCCRTILSLKNAFDYLNEEGYFSDYESFSDYKEGVLKIITMGEGITYPYGCNDTDVNHSYKYFIPKNKVVFEEPEEKKYKPYVYLDELPFNIGDVVYYRCKSCCSECRGIVTEIEYQSNNDGDLDNIIIGGVDCTPQELFDQYELKNDDCEWVPFGVEE